MAERVENVVELANENTDRAIGTAISAWPCVALASTSIGAFDPEYFTASSSIFTRACERVKVGRTAPALD